MRLRDVRSVYTLWLHNISNILWIMPAQVTIINPPYSLLINKEDYYAIV